MKIEIRLQNCKQLIKVLIQQCKPPELALQNYPKRIYDRAKEELFRDYIPNIQMTERRKS